jgi:hypothetical protein
MALFYEGIGQLTDGPLNPGALVKIIKMKQKFHNGHLSGSESETGL